MLKYASAPKRTVTLAIALAVLLPILTGCGLIGERDEFERRAENRPLEVPPDLDAPDNSAAMRVPGKSFSRVAGRDVDSDSAVSADIELTEPEITLRGGRSVLLVPDTPDSAYRRLGFALERIGLEITGRDEDGLGYNVEYIDTQARAERPGVLKRVFLRRKGPTDHSGSYRVDVNPSGAHSAIWIRNDVGAPATEVVAERLLSALAERLG